MTTEQLRFSLEEYEKRLSKTRDAMSASDLDLLIVTDPANMTWLSGYDGWSFYVQQCLIVPLDGQIRWFGREMDGNGARRTIYMDDGCVHTYTDEYVQSSERHPMSVLANLIVDNGWSKHRIGVEKDNYYFTARAYEVLVRELPNARFLDASRLVNWQRIIKSPAEISLMREAAKIVDSMHERVAAVIHPGMPQSDLVAEITQQGIKGVGAVWGDYPAAVPMMGAGADASAPHLTWSNKKIELNETLFLELAGVRQRYHCPLSRTYFLGCPQGKLIEVEHAVLEGIEMALEAAVPGNTCEDIARAFYMTLEAHDLNKSSRLGYSIGAGYPPDWGEHSASLRIGDRTFLQKGMTFHLIGGMWFGDWGLSISESILIENGKGECFSRFPRRVNVLN